MVFSPPGSNDNPFLAFLKKITKIRIDIILRILRQQYFQGFDTGYIICPVNINDNDNVCTFYIIHVLNRNGEWMPA